MLIFLGGARHNICLLYAYIRNKKKLKNNNSLALTEFITYKLDSYCDTLCWFLFGSE